MLEDPHKWRWPGTAGEFTKCTAKDPLPLYLDEELETLCNIIADQHQFSHPA